MSSWLSDILDAFDFDDKALEAAELSESASVLETVNSDLGIEMDTDVEFMMNSNDDFLVMASLDRMTNDIDGEFDLQGMQNFIEEKSLDMESWEGMVNNLKGIYGEVKVLEDLNDSGSEIHYSIPEATNNPGVDIYGLNENGNVVEKIQVKMTSNAAYIEETLKGLPEDVKIYCPSEIAEQFDDPRVISAGFTQDHLIGEIDDAIEVIKSLEPWQEALDADTEFNEWLDDEYVYA